MSLQWIVTFVFDLQAVIQKRFMQNKHCSLKKKKKTLQKLCVKYFCCCMFRGMDKCVLTRCTFYDNCITFCHIRVVSIRLHHYWVHFDHKFIWMMDFFFKIWKPLKCTVGNCADHSKVIFSLGLKNFLFLQNFFIFKILYRPCNSDPSCWL